MIAGISALGAGAFLIGHYVIGPRLRPAADSATPAVKVVTAPQAPDAAVENAPTSAVVRVVEKPIQQPVRPEPTTTPDAVNMTIEGSSNSEAQTVPPDDPPATDRARIRPHDSVPPGAGTAVPPTQPGVTPPHAGTRPPAPPIAGVTNEPPLPVPGPSRQTGTRRLARVQLGEFDNDGEAQDLAADLRGNGYTPSVVAVDRDGETVFRVQVGAFARRAAAEALAGRLRAQYPERSPQIVDVDAPVDSSGGTL
jgi:cell division septation protein DedD